MIGKGTSIWPYVIAAGAGAGLPLLLSLDPRLQPFWVMLGMLLVPFVVTGMLRYPAAFLAPAVFIPQLKDSRYLQPVQSHIDLTLVGLTILTLVVLITVVRPSNLPANRLFAGVGKGVATYVLFAAVVAMSYSYTLAPAYGWTLLSRFLGIGGLLFFSPLVLVRNEEDLKHFVIAFLCSAMILALEMVTRLEGSNPSQTTDVTRISSGWLLGMALLLLLFFKLFDKRLPRLFSILICGPVLMLGIVGSVSRGAIAALLLVVAVSPLFRHREKPIAARMISSLVVLTIVLIVATLSYYAVRPYGHEKYQGKIDELNLNEVVDASQTARPKSSIGERLRFYSFAIRSFSERPVLGLGVGGWNMYYYGRDQQGDPHNLFLQVAAEEGLFGVVALLIFLGVTAAALRRILDATGDRFTVLASLLLYMLVTSMFSGDLDDDRALWLWCSIVFAVFRITVLVFAEPLGRPPVRQASRIA